MDWPNNTLLVKKQVFEQTFLFLAQNISRRREWPKKWPNENVQQQYGPILVVGPCQSITRAQYLFIWQICACYPVQNYCTFV
jgi:hypothetical protein